MKVLLSIFILLLTLQINAQCDTWVGKANETEIKEWHAVYRSALKGKEWSFAEENWEKAFAAAPAADGRRSTHYKDGIKILKEKLKNEADEAKQEEIKARIISIYDQAIECYKSKSITQKCVTEECYNVKIGKLEGRKGYDMYYTLKSPASENLATLKNAIKFSGDKVEYVVFAPLAKVAVKLFQDGKMEKTEARELHDNMMILVDKKIEEKGKYLKYFNDSKTIITSSFSAIATEIFDCAYFVKSLKPSYEADPDNPDVLKRTIAKLKSNGCEAGEPFLDELETKWSAYAAAANAKKQSEFDAKNPSRVAKKLYDQGKYEEAIAKYEEAITNSTDMDKNAGYYFSIASIQFRKLNQLSTARKTALKAAELRKGWGRPYLLIGDMYAKSSRKCGKDWDQRLAVLAAIEKYRYAKSVDSSSTDEADRKISLYYASKPTQDMGFMRGKSKGDRVKVGCWIGETVTLSYQ